MGKRKCRKALKPQPKKLPKLDTEFDCPFCNHQRTVLCRLLRTEHHGSVLCTVCGVSYVTTIHNLSHPVDIFHEWIDACQAVN